MYGVFGTNTILVQIEMYTAFQYQETDAHYLYLHMCKSTMSLIFQQERETK